MSQARKVLCGPTEHEAKYKDAISNLTNIAYGIIIKIHHFSLLESLKTFEGLWSEVLPRLTV